MANQVDASPRYVRYTVAGATQAVFNITFPLDAIDAITVYKNGALIDPSWYTVAADFTTVTFGGGHVPVLNDIVTLDGNTAVLRTDGFQVRGPFSAALLNKDANRETMILQEIIRDLKRKIYLSLDGSSSVSLSFPAPAANCVIVGNSNATGWVNGPAITDISAVAADLANINLVAGSIANVNTVSAAVANINTVAGNIASVSAVAGAIGEVIAVNANAANINAVAGAVGAINAVSGDLTNINLVAADLANIDTLAGDKELKALAGLVSAADTVPYFTGSGTAALATFTATGRSVVGAASAAAVRTAIGTVIGTDVQAYDAELAALAGLVSAADSLPYFTGSGTAALATFTATGRSLVDDASVSAMRTTLGSTATGDALFTAASASAARTTLGTVIGTDVQAYDAELAALAGLTSAADRLPYFTGSGTASLATFNAAGRDLLALTALAQGDIVYYNGSNFVRLGAGTSGWFLKTQGSAANPVWAAIPSGGDMLAANNLSDLVNKSTSRTNLGVAIGTDVQAYDAELAALAGLTSAADSLPYFTGAGTAALATFTATGRSLVDDASTSAMRTTLGLVIGTDVQAYDAELAALAGLTSAANAVPVFTGSGTAGLITLTASTLVGMGSTGNAAKITLGTGLSMSGAVLSASAAGGAIDIQSFTGTGANTWTKPGSGTWAFIQCWAGGGSGASGANSSTIGGGGGGGGYKSAWILLSRLGGTETATVGAGGAAIAGTSTVGNVGGNSTFGAWLTAYGGGGGFMQASSGAGSGGGGGGSNAVGAVGASTSTGGAGGAVVGGVGGVSGTAAGDSSMGGGGGGGSNASPGRNGGNSVNGGGGGGAAANGGTAGAGGTSTMGGGGGGGSGAAAGGAGGASEAGGAGGAGGVSSTSNGTDGTQPGGGGGGAMNTKTSGKGGDGKIVVMVF
jgi:hypothetical protein